MNNKFTLPIQMYTKNDTVELDNTNFHKVKITIMHTGENFNGSVFSEESIRCSLNTLANIPILGFVETKDYGSRDFKGHEIDYDVFEDENGNIKLRQYYKEVPIGVIPESNEYFMEEIDGEVYLGCYGYIWKNYSNDAYDILLEDREKEVSMEILIKECSYDRRNRCNINKFEFLGVTVLGADTPGAMGNKCELTLDFSTDTEQQSEYALFSDKVVKLNNYLKGKESVSEVSEEIKDVIVEFEEEDKDNELCPDCQKNPCECKEDEEEFAEVCPKCEKNPCECEDEEEDEFKCKDDEEEEKCAVKEDDDEEEKCSIEFEEKDEEDKEENDEDKKDDKEEDEDEEYSVVSEEFAREENEEECSVEEVEVKEEDKEVEVKEDKEEFSLSLNNIFKSLNEYFSAFTFEYTSFWGDTFECKKYLAVDLIPQDSIVVVYDNEIDEYYGVTYSIEKDDVVCDLNSAVVYIKEWRVREERDAKFELEQSERREAVFYNVIAEEYHALKDFKAEVERLQAVQELQESVDNILQEFSFTEEETSELVSKVFEGKLSLEDFEEKLFALEGRKARQRKENFANINSSSNGLNIVDVKEEEIPKGKYFDIIQKYGKK